MEPLGRCVCQRWSRAEPMLRQRIITAVVLLALLIPALVWPSAWPFQLLTLLLLAAAGWEWARLNDSGGSSPVLWAGLVVALSAFGWMQRQSGVAGVAAWVSVGVLWVAAGAWALHRGPQGWSRCSSGLRRVVGVAMLAAAWLALAQAREVGVAFVLSVFCLVWVADIAAYFGGHRWGRRKLAPVISPGKTWEGAVSGMLAVLVLSLAWQGASAFLPALRPNLFGMLNDWLGLWGSCLVLLGLTGMSIVGDLFESLVKRAAAVKDSSGLLPGHGGVLDRIDALLPVFPLVAMLMAWGALR